VARSLGWSLRWCCKKTRNQKLTKEKRSPPWWCFVRAILRFNVLEKSKNCGSDHLSIGSGSMTTKALIDLQRCRKKRSFLAKKNTWPEMKTGLGWDNLFAAWCQRKCNMHQSQSPWHSLRCTNGKISTNSIFAEDFFGILFLEFCFVFFRFPSSNFQSAALVYALFVFSACFTLKISRWEA
jgi:hypothetical protein